MTKSGGRALVTGITGQDGAYLAHLLLQKGYQVFGAIRPGSKPDTLRLKEFDVADQVEFVELDLLDFSRVVRKIEQLRPDEIYNLAAQQPQSAPPPGLQLSPSDRDSLRLEPEPMHTGDCNALGVARLLEAIRTVNPGIRFFQASSSEMFGKIPQVPQTEATPFAPRSSYGAAKLYGHWMSATYREQYGLHASSGILFNHESPLRGQAYVTRKITVSLAKIKHGELRALDLGNLGSQRDWGFAADYVHAMWLMLQAIAGGDYVLATGSLHSVRDFVSAAGAVLVFEIAFEGSGIEERGIDRRTGRAIVRVDPKYHRPDNNNILCGDPSRIERSLGWSRSTTFLELVALMAEADDRRVRDKRLTF